MLTLKTIFIHKYTKNTPMTNSSAIIWMDTVDSTNKEVRRRLESLDNMSVISATEQTAGRGQGDHTWHSRPGENLTFTLLLKFSQIGVLPARDAGRINDFVTSSLLAYLASHGIQARIKLPNDIYVGDKKICGMLIENILDGANIGMSIIGIGLDVNQTDFPEDLPNPVSMAQLTGRSYTLEEELARLIAEMQSHLPDLLP